MEEEKEVQSIAQSLEKRRVVLTQKKKRGGVNSAVSYAIEQLMVFMGEDPKDSKRFRYWLGRTRKLEVKKIYEFMSRAKGSKNPPALFNWFLKKYLESVIIK